MPKRFIRYSRTEPARTILFLVAALTFLMQGLFVGLHFGLGLVPNLLIVGSFCSWTLWSAVTSNVKHMSMSSFWMFMVWLWSAISRLLFSADPAQLLWMPMLIVAIIMSVVYIYLSAQKRQGL